MLNHRDCTPCPFGATLDSETPTGYLAHRDHVDRYLWGRQQDFDAARQAARDADPMFYQKLTDAKKQTPLTP